MGSVANWIGKKPTSGQLKIIIVLFIVSRLSLLLWVYPNKKLMHNGDSLPYTQLAVNFIDNGKYTYQNTNYPWPDMVRPPGYPAIIALGYALFNNTLLFPVLINLACGVGVLLLLLKLNQRFLGGSTRLVLLMFVADVGWLLYSKEIIADQVFALLTLWVLFLLTHPNSRRYVFWAGLVLGVATLLKPITLYLWLPVAVWIFFRQQKAIQPLLWVAGFALAVLPWYARNYHTNDAWVFTSIKNYNLCYSHGAYVVSSVRNIPFTAAQDTLFARVSHHISTHATDSSFATVNQAEGYVARQIIKNHPFIYAKAVVRGMVATLFDPGRLVFSRTFPNADGGVGFNEYLAQRGLLGTLKVLFVEKTGLALVLLPYMVALLFLNVAMAAALFFLLKTWLQMPVNQRYNWLLCGLFFMYLWVLGGPNGYIRFRLYLLPFILIFVNLFFLNNFKKSKHNQTTLQ